MSIYVDDNMSPFRSELYCHMIADTHDELMAMARAIGLRPDWIQRPGTAWEHFDLAPSKRERAISAGATVVSWKELAVHCREKHKRELDARLSSP